jgi:hypothetical protein
MELLVTRLEKVRNNAEFLMNMNQIIHQKQRRAVVDAQVAGGDVLLVPRVIGKSQRVRVEDSQKARRAAAMLNVRPAVRSDRAHIKTVSGSNEFRLIRPNFLFAHTELAHALVRGAGAEAFLELFGSVGKHGFSESMRHNCLRKCFARKFPRRADGGISAVRPAHGA